MAKTKTPLLSLGAKGTIADTLTFQKRGKTSLVRKKPIPSDPYSLTQAYQRWDYKDFAYLWTLLTNSEKQVYRTRGSRYHITGFSQFMRESLKELTDILGRWHLDEASGAIAYDSSKQGNNGTIIGASPASGLISEARYFDGINDSISCGPGTALADLSSTGNFTAEGFFKGTAVASGYALGQAHTLLPYSSDWFIWGTLANILVWFRGVTVAIPPGFDATIWHHIAILWSKAAARYMVYLDGDYFAISAVVAGYGGIGPVVIGARPDLTAQFFQGHVDEVRITEGLLDFRLIKRHSERRYPP